MSIPGSPLPLLADSNTESRVFPYTSSTVICGSMCACFGSIVSTIWFSLCVCIASTDWGLHWQLHLACDLFFAFSLYQMLCDTINNALLRPQTARTPYCARTRVASVIIIISHNFIARFQLFKTIFQGGRVHVDLLKQIQPKERRVGGCGGALITLTLNFLFPQCKFSHTLQSKPGTKRSRLPSLCYFTSLWVCIVW